MARFLRKLGAYHLEQDLVVTDRRDTEGRDTMALGGRVQLTWAHQLRHRRSPRLDHCRLRWYRDPTLTYRLSAGYVVPWLLKAFAHVTTDGLECIPPTGPVILAANHRDNLDAYLLLHLVPRIVHTVARADAFGTGALWRHLGAFPADAWGMRYALTLLNEGRCVAIFPQFARSGPCSPRSLTVAEDVLRLVDALLAERPPGRLSPA